MSGAEIPDGVTYLKRFAWIFILVFVARISPCLGLWILGIYGVLCVWAIIAAILEERQRREY